MARFGPYELLSKLGDGEAGEVHLAQGPSGEPCVVKLFFQDAIPIDQVQVLQRDTAKAAMVRHPNVVQLLEAGDQDGQIYVAMEYVSGRPLLALTRKLRERDGALALPEACFVVRELCLGLHHAHEARMCHRDVVPQNVLVAHDGRIKVSDLGLEAVLVSPMTRIPYLAPEQLKNESPDRRADVFSAAAVLFELLCGRKLCPGSTETEMMSQALSLPQPDPRRFAPAMPAALAELLERALARDAAKRTPTALLVAQGLERFAVAEAQRQIASRMEVSFEADLEQARARLSPPPGALMTDPVGVHSLQPPLNTDPVGQALPGELRRMMHTASLRAPSEPTKNIRRATLDPTPQRPDVTGSSSLPEPPRAPSPEITAPLPLPQPPRELPSTRVDLRDPAPPTQRESGRSLPRSSGLRDPAPPLRRESGRSTRKRANLLTPQQTVIALAVAAALGGLAVGYVVTRFAAASPRQARLKP